MRVPAAITYASLCRQLGVSALPGIVSGDGKPIDGDGTVVRLRSVVVADDDARQALIERDAWEDEPTLADDADTLSDFIGALLAGDVALARILGDRVFENERMRLTCDQALSIGVRRRAA